MTLEDCGITMQLFPRSTYSGFGVSGYRAGVSVLLLGGGSSDTGHSEAHAVNRFQESASQRRPLAKEPIFRESPTLHL